MKKRCGMTDEEKKDVKITCSCSGCLILIILVLVIIILVKVNMVKFDHQFF